ncbi:MAG TPA: thioredoxin domain-containing protein, partial [Terriglobia bacterium]|nr:thioredoxin domain-containing protein [Terriglobia bacterium]
MSNAASNSLGKASSAYLRSAAHQPVRWHEWGDEAFEKASRENKPILLDIGAVWCHWCHVMDRESYENAEIARLINEHYVPIKVDRDERPDIDARYQLAVSALTGQGGWPLTAFLTPAGKPFYGGTYFPPEDLHGRPGMKRVLASIAQNYQSHQTEIFSSADQISAALAGAENFEKGSAKAGRATLEAIVSSIGSAFDPQYGGFGSAPKFPHPGAIDLLLDAYLETKQAWLLSVVAITLEAMARGGVYDQIGGGFHRYSVDERWIVPHFEKMSYDNAGLLGNYLRAWQVSRADQLRTIARGTVQFVTNILSDPAGGFYASQDADINLDDDGDYFTWTLDEVKAALDPDDAAIIAQRYHVEPDGEMHHNPAKNVLFIDQPIEAIEARLNLKPEEVAQRLDRAIATLYAARLKRPTPFVDTMVYASWNGMMISAFLDAYKILDDEAARAKALATLDLLLAKAYDPARGVAHALSISPKAGAPSGLDGHVGNPDSVVSSSGFPVYNFDFRVSNFDLLDDQVFMAQALLDAFEVTGKLDYYQRALELAETMLRRFWDDASGGFFDTARDLEKRLGNLTQTRKSIQDSPTPAANSVAACVLDRLAVLADRPDFRQKAEATLDLFAPKATEYGLFAATFGLALANHLRAPVEVVVIGYAAD